MHEGWRPQATAIVHGLAQDVLCGDAPSNLMDVCHVQGGVPWRRSCLRASMSVARLGGVERETDGSSLSSSEPWEYET
jgi:hypothetical protein